MTTTVRDTPSPDRDDALSVGWGGWALYRGAKSRAPVLVRFRKVKGRWRVVETYLDTPQGLDTDTLRQIPLGAIEATANSPQLARWLEVRSEYPGLGFRDVAGHYDTLLFNAPDAQWLALHGVDGDGGRALPARRINRLRQRRPAEAPDATLPKPTGRDYGDGFYESVGTTYTEVCRVESAPAKVIADANGVPVTTARRWIKEARRRGFLAPGTAGKVG